MKNLIKTAAVAATMTPALALAHDAHESTNMLAGLLHFISSPDHLLTIGVVGAIAGYAILKFTQE